MKFKLLGIVWDLTIPIGALWAFTGIMLIGLTFAIPSMGWWNIIYFGVCVVYLSTASAIENILKKGK